MNDLVAMGTVAILAIGMFAVLAWRPSRSHRRSVDEALEADALDREEDERRNRAAYEDAQLAIRMKGGG